MGPKSHIGERSHFATQARVGGKAGSRLNKRRAGISVGTAVFALAALLATMVFPRMADAGIKQDAREALGCLDETDLKYASGEIEVSTHRHQR